MVLLYKQLYNTFDINTYMSGVAFTQQKNVIDFFEPHDHSMHITGLNFLLVASEQQCGDDAVCFSGLPPQIFKQEHLKVSNFSSEPCLL